MGVGYYSTTFDRIDGRDLRNGTLVSTASILRGESAPFDIETVALRIRTDTMTLTGNVGVTDRFDIGAAIPFVRVSLQGERVDTYRGRELVQAAGTASASGLGDAVVRAKYNVLRDGGSGLAIGVEARLPTGREEDLLGSGRASFAPRLIGSYERDRVGVHGELGYSFRGVSDILGYAAAVTVVAVPRLTIVGELSGLRIDGLGRLAETTQSHPGLVGVEHDQADRRRTDNRSHRCRRRLQMECREHVAVHGQRAPATDRRRPRRGLGADHHVRLFVRPMR